MKDIKQLADELRDYADELHPKVDYDIYLYLHDFADEMEDINEAHLSPDTDDVDKHIESMIFAAEECAPREDTFQNYLEYALCASLHIDDYCEFADCPVDEKNRRDCEKCIRSLFKDALDVHNRKMRILARAYETTNAKLRKLAVDYDNIADKLCEDVRRTKGCDVCPINPDGESDFCPLYDMHEETLALNENR